MRKSVKKVFLLAFILLANGVLAFPCRTPYGAFEVVGLDGFVAGNAQVRKNIQRTRKAIGSHDGKVVCVLVRSEEVGNKDGFSELISISPTSIDVPLSDEDFDQVAETTRTQIEGLHDQVIRGLVFGGFSRGRSYYYNTMEMLKAENGNDTAFTLMGGVLIGHRLFSFVAHSSAVHTAEQRQAWTSTIVNWLERLLAANANGFLASDPWNPPMATVANIDTYALAGVTLERTVRERTPKVDGADAIDAKFEHPKSIVEATPSPGATQAFARDVDDFEFRIEIGETRFDATLDAALDLFANAKKKEAEEMAQALATQLVLADGDADAGKRKIFATGIFEVDGRNAVWADTWRPAPPGAKGSALATKTVWVQADGGRAFSLRFTLRDQLTSLVPVADLQHFNVSMMKIADSVRFQNKKQFKKR